MKPLTLIIAVLISTCAMAQNDAKAKTILDKMSQKFQNYQGMQIDFSLVMENLQEDIKEKSNGEAWVKGNQYKIDLMGVETYYNGKTNWSFLKDAEEVNVSEPSEDDLSTLNPSKLFNSYKEGYKIRYKKEVFENNRALHIIDLYPIDVKGSEFSIITLKINKDNNELYKVIRVGKDGNNYTLTLFKINKKSDLKDSMFVFDKSKHPDVEIIDLRD